jgi:hypothetical protein
MKHIELAFLWDRFERKTMFYLTSGGFKNKFSHRAVHVIEDTIWRQVRQPIIRTWYLIEPLED